MNLRGRSVGFDEIQHVIDGPIDVHLVFDDVSLTGDGSQIANDPASSQRLLGDVPARLSQCLCIHLPMRRDSLAGLRVVRDRAQRLVDFVRHACRQLAHQAQSVHLDQLVLQPLVLFLGRLLRGEIAKNANKEAVGATHRQMYRKRCSVRAPPGHLPADADDPFFTRAEVPRDVPVVPGPVGLGHQQGHVVSNDLLGRKTEHALRSGIEIQNRAAVVDHDDAVGGRVHERPEPGAVQFHGTAGCRAPDHR